MTKLFYIIGLIYLAVTLSACGTAKKKEYKDIDLSDENLFKEVKYDKKTDHYEDTKISEHDSLTYETIARVDKSDLSVFKRSNDPLTKVTALCYRKDFKSSKEYLDNMYFKYKKNPSYWTLVGTCFFLERKYKKAKWFYNKALEFNNNYAPAINNLGVLLQKERKFQRALKAYERAMLISKKSLTPRFNSAQLYLQFGLAEKALVNFKKLYKINKNDKDVLVGMANSYLFLGKPKQAAKLFSRLNDAYYARPEVGLNYAVSLYVLGYKKESKEIFEMVDLKKRSSWRAYYKRVKRVMK